jgi:carbamoyltransferase
MAEPWVLGLSMGFHNGAACLCHGSEIVAAVQEERLTRVKRDRIKDPAASKAIAYCLDVAKKHIRDVDLIVCCPIDMSE